MRNSSEKTSICGIDSSDENSFDPGFYICYRHFVFRAQYDQEALKWKYYCDYVPGIERFSPVVQKLYDPDYLEFKAHDPSEQATLGFSVSPEMSSYFAASSKTRIEWSSDKETWQPLALTEVASNTTYSSTSKRYEQTWTLSRRGESLLQRKS